MNEAIGRAIPVAIIPWVNDALAAHPAYKESLARIESAGVHVATPIPGSDVATTAVEVVGTPL